MIEENGTLSHTHPDTAAQMAERALEHIVQLSEAIGPRPPGSSNENKALIYIEEQLASFGLAAERTGFLFPHNRFTPWITAAGVLFLVYASANRPPLPGLFLPLSLMLAPDLGRWWNRRRKGSIPSSNVYTSVIKENQPTLILCAHADSGKAAVLNRPFLLKLRGVTMDIAQRIALLLATLALAELAGLALPNPIPAAAAGLAAITGFWLVFSETVEQCTRRDSHSPGANDNASGVGLVLALAEHYAINQPESFNLVFLFTGAEEAGLHGARSLARCLGPDSRTAVLSLDMVGIGDTLRYASRDGVFFFRRADARLNEFIQQAAPRAQPLWYSLRSGDFAPFLENGIPATGLQVTGNAKADLYYHTAGDLADRVELPALKLTAQTLLDLIDLLESQPAQLSNRRS
jgi:hypothetical protein